MGALRSAAKVFIVAVITVLAILIIGLVAVRYGWAGLPSVLQDFFRFFVGYNRGVGKIPDCGAKEYDAGLCYGACQKGYDGVGPVCWEACPPGMRDTGISCQKQTYGRGVGTIPQGCPSGQVNDAGLCYPACQGGYDGAGPVCWQACPPGFTDTGFDCWKPPAYGRGAGWSTQTYCVAGTGRPCEEWGGLWYPVCASGYENYGCCVCSPVCPPGMTDTGAACQKSSYGRGAGGVPETCPPGQVNDAGLCYNACAAGYSGAGPVCWQDCPSDMKSTGVACLKNTYGRGAGSVPESCPSGQANQAGLCYADCDSGYKGVAFMCWRDWLSYFG